MKSLLKIKYWILVAFILILTASRTEVVAQTQNATDSALSERMAALELQANYTKPGEDHLLVVGLATFGFVSSKTTNTIDGVSKTIKSNSFPDADHFEFSPMFLWRHGTKFLMEFEPSFSNNGLSVNWADISYFAAPNLIIRAGYLVVPFGTYSKRLAAGWINKLATDPMGVADMAPSDYGIEVEGGLPLGSMKMNYDFALTNSMQLNNDGTLSSGSLGDANNNKAFTGRLGILPFSNSTLELGVSGMFGKVGTPGTTFQNAKGQSYAFDLNYVNTIQPFLINIKAQYNIQNISDVNYISPVDSVTAYSFTNHSTAAFIQGSVRPTTFNNFLHDIELAGRYTTYNTPTNSTWGSNQNSFTLGLSYWFSWRSALRLSYESYTGNSTASKALNAFTGKTLKNSWYLQFAIQL
jgi:hypothetical protein